MIRQQMGYKSQRMTTLYSGEIPLDQVRAAFSFKIGTKNVVLENMETRLRRKCLKRMERPIGLIRLIRHLNHGKVEF